MKIPGRVWTWMKMRGLNETLHILNFGMLGTLPTLLTDSPQPGRFPSVPIKGKLEKR